MSGFYPVSRPRFQYDPHYQNQPRYPGNIGFDQHPPLPPRVAPPLPRYFSPYPGLNGFISPLPPGCPPPLPPGRPPPTPTSQPSRHSLPLGGPIPKQPDNSGIEQESSVDQSPTPTNHSLAPPLPGFQGLPPTPALCQAPYPGPPRPPYTLSTLSSGAPGQSQHSSLHNLDTNPTDHMAHAVVDPTRMTVHQEPVRTGLAGNNEPVRTAMTGHNEPVRTGLAGVKRKGLAQELLESKASSHHVNWTLLWDTDMPAELLSRCQPLYCDLCSCSFSSPVQAKMHYEGKIHDKHVRGYFSKAGISPSYLPLKMNRSGQFPHRTRYHCDVCNIEFTSQQTLTQHTMGRNHLRTVSGQGQTKPTHFNKESKRWEKTAVLDQVVEATPGEVNTEFFCDLCKVGAPSQPQLDMHLNGKNHKKKMEKRMGGLKTNDLEAIQKRMKLKESVMRTMQNSNARRPGSGPPVCGRKDYSSYRTPSGSFYCAACNTTVNSEAQFEQHFSSKKHKQKETAHKLRRV